MVHRKNPIFRGLALGFALLTPQLAAAAALDGGETQYSGVVDRGLASRDGRATITEGKPVRVAQDRNASPGGEDSVDARKKLKAELDRIRRSGEANSDRNFDPPKPVRKKPTQAAATDASPQPVRSSDPEIDRVLGHLLLMRFKGNQPSDGGPKAIRSLLQSGLIAGAVFGADNIQSKAQLKEVMKFFASPGSPRPLFAIGEIGGVSDSLPAVRDFEQWPSQKDIAAKGDPEYAYSTYRSMGTNLAVLGFNMNFGPIVGASANARNASATFGDNPLQAGVFTKTFILGHREENVIPVPVVDGSDLSVRALKTLLVSYPDTPIAANVPQAPATPPLSPYNGLVRGARFCFVTLVAGSEGTDAARRFNEGCDILVLNGGSESPSNIRDRVAQGVSDAVKQGTLSLNALNASSQRISLLRSSLASLPNEVPTRAPRSPQSE